MRWAPADSDSDGNLAPFWIPASSEETHVAPRECRGAKPLCREFEGVPQFFLIVPPRLGVKGVDHSAAGQVADLTLTSQTIHQL